MRDLVGFSRAVYSPLSDARGGLFNIRVDAPVVASEIAARTAR